MPKLQIAVIGNDDYAGYTLSADLLRLAESVGQEIAKNGAILICGGRRGVMEAAARGAKKEGGITVGILPSDSWGEANEFIDVVVPTGVGLGMRDALTIRAAHAVIALGGGVGTLREITLSYSHKRPIVCIKGTGGWSDRLIGTYIDDRKMIRIKGASSAKDAVKIAIETALKALRGNP